MTYIQGKTGKWQYVIGLEVHAQITSSTKLFSRAPTKFGMPPNSQVALLDAGMPGMLPVPNMQCITQAVKTGLGINCHINRISIFDRKNYFYADLPQGYQISQFYHPIAVNGWLDIQLEDQVKRIGIRQLHIEQDAGKSMHDQHDDLTLVDLNRSGIALMEIVSNPDLSSPKEVELYLKKLRSIMRYLGTCDGDMEKGSLRCDANVSVKRSGGELGTRCEIKNLNSIRNIMDAIEHEAARQVEILENGGEVKQETRLFDTTTGTTRTLRSKEEAFDYRYFPDPDLLPLHLSEELIDEITASMPELPDAKAQRYMNDYALSAYDTEKLIEDREVAKYFEEALKATTSAKLLANWIIVELFGYCNREKLELSQCKVAPEDLAGLVNLITSGTISGKIAKDIFEEMCASGEKPESIQKRRGLHQISDIDELTDIIEQVLAQNQTSVAQYKAGKEKLLGFFVGKAMAQTGGRANPNILNDLLRAKLAEQ